MTSTLTKIAQEKSAAQLQAMSRQSYEWLKKKVENLRNPLSIANEIARESNRQGGRFNIGGLYFFYYDPKTKDNLPYYDRFPLVLVLERYSDGFLGLNLHYLPVKYRIAFLDKLMTFAQGEADDIKRMRVSYDILSASRRYKEFKPCLKRYLHGHVQSKILAVQPNEWETAVFLPLQQFRKATPNKVWQESLEKMGTN